MAETTKKYLDLAGLSYYDDKIKLYIGTEIGKVSQGSTDGTKALNLWKSFASDAVAAPVTPTLGTIATAIGSGEGSILAQAKAYADGLNTTMDGRVAKLEAINHDAYKAADTALEATLKSYADDAATTAETNAKDHADGLNADMDARVDTLETAVGNSASGLVKDVADIKADYLKAADKTELEGDITALQTTVGNNESGLVKKVNDLQDASHSHSNKTVLDGIAGTDVTSWNTAATDVATIKADYLKAADKTELNGKITAIGTRVTNEAPVTIAEADGTGDILKTYTFTQNGTEIGKINIAKELVVTKGEIVTINGVKNLQLTIANQETPVNIPVKDLVDVYTGSNYVTISDDNVISVNIGNNGLATDAAARSYAEAVETSANNHTNNLNTAMSNRVGALETTVGNNTSAIGTLESAVDALESAVDTLESAVDTLESTVGDSSSGLVKSVATNTTDITTLKAAVNTLNGTGTGSVANSISAAINALDATVTSNNSGHITVKVTETDGKITEVAVTESDIASASALSTLQTTVGNDDSGLVKNVNDLQTAVNAFASITDGEIDDLF